MPATSQVCLLQVAAVPIGYSLASEFLVGIYWSVLRVYRDSARIAPILKSFLARRRRHILLLVPA